MNATTPQGRRARDGSPAVDSTPHKVLRRAEARLESSPQFFNHLDTLQLEFRQGELIVRGRVPSFYLKSLLTHILSDILGVSRLDNQVEVVSCEALSSPPRSGTMRRETPE